MVNIKSTNFYIRDLKKKDINRTFLKSLNDKSINKFLSINKKKQTLTDALKYFQYMKKHNNFYLAVFSKLNDELMGTITYRQTSKKSCGIGFMVSNTKFLGKSDFFYAVKSTVIYMFKKLNISIIQAATNKTNIQSSFFLLKLGFKMIGKSHYSFDFVKYRNTQHEKL